MSNPQTIHTTPAVLRCVGMIFFLVGVGVMVLILTATLNGKWNGLYDVCFPLGIGGVFAFVGWAVFADDYMVVDTWSREVVFYQRRLRTTESGRTALTDQSRLRIEPDPDHECCYRLMLDDKLVRERMSMRQIERLKARLETALGLG